MRLGIFGGSFDPVHNGHLALARACQRQVALDEVWFMPTAVQPLKARGPHASDSDRVEMLRLATLDEPAWRVCTLEIERGGRSYTIDTMRQLREELPEAMLFFLIGADALRDVAQWKDPREIFRLATPLVVHRPGEAQPSLETLGALCTSSTQPLVVNMPLVDISSTEIRRRVGAGDSIESFTPEAVAQYIAARELYRTQ
ncbi:MAG TPA: nicotinate-nucleotide adenylyltransferase [Lacipirellulaceae bacterium]|jgi:nicotinate-nucleotide adenylyltransferase|nr:nicotinate-nucleotide adenylyltransferase [Lacipirellulaceae bacterium]